MEFYSYIFGTVLTLISIVLFIIKIFEIYLEIYTMEVKSDSQLIDSIVPFILGILFCEILSYIVGYFLQYFRWISSDEFYGEKRNVISTIFLSIYMIHILSYHQGEYLGYLFLITLVFVCVIIAKRELKYLFETSRYDFINYHGT